MYIPKCITCGSDDGIGLVTYKRIWNFCRKCGTATPRQRDRYPLWFLPYADFKPNPELDPEGMYDYFTDDAHIRYSVEEAKDFWRMYMEPNGFNVAGKRILDISGGNGYFIKTFAERGGIVTLTEFNTKTVEYARQVHDFEDVQRYDINRDKLSHVVKGLYDIILCRANIMFCRDLKRFVIEIKKCLKPGGILILNHCVQPTLGVIIRVQLDEHSYEVLRQPETIIEAFASEGFVLHSRHDETDPSMYVYDHDLLLHWFMVHYLYEIKCAIKLRKERIFSFAARDRRRSTMIMRGPAG